MNRFFIKIGILLECFWFYSCAIELENKLWMCASYDYVTPANDLGYCIHSDYNSILSRTLILGISDTLNLTTCMTTDDAVNCCTARIEAYSSSSMYLNMLAENILSEPVNTCTCLNTYLADFQECYDVMKSLHSYCVQFYGNDFVVYDSASPSFLPTLSPADVSDYSSCSDAIKAICDTNGDGVITYNEAVSCVMQNAAILENDCESILSSVAAVIVSSCNSDLIEFCPNSLTSPIDALTCLFENIPSLSSTCQQQIISVAQSENIPCASEATYYCSGIPEIEQIIKCLADLDDSKLSSSCRPFIDGYKQCENSNTGDNNDNGGGGGGGKKKPSPGSIESTSNLNGKTWNHLIERKGFFQSFNLFSSKKSSTMLTQTTDSRKRVLKQAPCWAKQISNDGGGDGSDDDKSSINTASTLPPGPSGGTIAGICILVVILTLLGVAGFKRVYDKYYVLTNSSSEALTSDGSPMTAVAMKTLLKGDSSYTQLPGNDA